ncbi:Levodione reductase [Lachnellula occidentalis]|uniref:Levodione reductase n=1 Tax=Lachnellula occidentalis TaxID=215460 RepID=A0A8H8RLZ6_9HELO|nr:Levodione reductase [Lachnellula occidentalis]
MTSLEGKVITVTGAASGMGLATAMGIFNRGADISISDISEVGLEKAVSAIKAAAASKTTSNTVITTVVDIRDSDQVDSWIAKTVKYFGRLDGSANVAGVIGKNYGIHELTELSNEEWDFIHGTNLRGLFYCMRAQLRAMTTGGSLVNCSSVTGLEGHAKNAAYSASKHGVIGLTRSAANEVGERGIRVNVIAPSGIFNTPMIASFGAVDSGKLEVFNRVPLKRIGEPEEIANLFAWLLSDESKYVTGSTYVMDGGMLG